MRYYFHVYDDIIATDEEGTELSTAEAAIEHARIAARELICEEARAGCVHLHHRIEVEDESRAPVTTMWFRDAVDVQP